MHIDIATVILLFNTSAFAGALALWHLRRQSSNKSGLLPLSLGFAALGVCSLLAGLGEYEMVPKIIWTHVSMLGGAGGYMAMAVGFRALNYGRTRRYTIVFALVLLLLLATSLITGFWMNDRIRALVFLTLGAFLQGLAAYKVARKNTSEPLNSRLPLHVSLELGSINYLCMIVIALELEAYRPLIAWGFVIQMTLNFLTTIFIYGLVKERLENKLRNISELDVLTQIGNRRWFNESAPKKLSRQDGLIIFDIDHFKAVNDRYGHPVGDYVLQTVAAEITRQRRDNDLFARYGGEEFILFMSELDRQELMQIGERLRRAVESLRLKANGEMVQVTISLGLAWNDGRWHTLAEMIQAADQALYNAKASGRNTTQMYAAPVPPIHSAH